MQDQINFVVVVRFLLAIGFKVLNFRIYLSILHLVRAIFNSHFDCRFEGLLSMTSTRSIYCYFLLPKDNALSLERE